MKLAFALTAIVMVSGCASNSPASDEEFLAGYHTKLNHILRDLRAPLGDLNALNSEYVGFQQQVLGRDVPNEGIDVRPFSQPINQIQRRLDDLSNTGRRLDVLGRRLGN